MNPTSIATSSGSGKPKNAEARMAVILAPWDLSSLAVPGEILLAEFGSIVNVRFAAGARALLAKSEDLQSDQSCVNKPLMNFIVRLMPRAMLSYIICIAARKRDVAKLTSFHHDLSSFADVVTSPYFPDHPAGIR